MKKSVKILAVLLSLMFVVSAFAACGGSTSTTTTKKASVSAEDSSAASSVIQYGKAFSVATNAAFEPYEYMDADGNITGIDYDLMTEIGSLIGSKVTFQNMEFDSVISAVTSGSCLVGASGLTITDERKQSVDFSDPYQVVSQIVITTANDTTFTGKTKDEVCTQIKNASGTIGVCSGYTGEAFVKDTEADGGLGLPESRYKSYASLALALQDLKNGTLVAVIMDDSTAVTAINEAANKGSFKVNETALTTEDYAFAVTKGNTALLNSINSALAKLKADGTVDKIFAKYAATSASSDSTEAASVNS